MAQAPSPSSTSYLQSNEGGLDGLQHSVIGPLTKDDCSKGTNFKLSPEGFFAHHAVSDKSNEHRIEAIHSRLTSRGFYTEDEGWILQNVPLPDFNNATENPSTEDRWAALFGCILHVASSWWIGSWRSNGWRSHELHLVEGQRKPDIILVPTEYQLVKSVPFGAVLTCVEFKESFNNANLQAASLQLQQCAGLATASRIDRNFFLGALLLGRELILVLTARGATFYSRPLNIDTDPICFIKAIIVLSSGVDPILGFDTGFVPVLGGTYHLPLGDRWLAVTRRTWARGITMSGRGTKVPLCRDPSDETLVFALKDCWLPRDGPNDVVNRDIFASRKPKEMTTDQQKIFGAEDMYNIFRECRLTRGTQWDYEKNLPGIPIIVYADFSAFEHTSIGGFVKDTTEAISSRFSETELSMDRRIHIRTLSETCGIPILWFSCRRQLISGMMCVVAAHFNGELKHLLHSDISDTNIWICVNDPEDPDDVISSWPKELHSYPKHSVVLGDWGMAEDRSPENKDNSYAGGMTGTFPFIAAELMSETGIAGSIAHDTCHDLEAIFWVLWIMSVNTAGPYNQRREWRNDWYGPFRGHHRKPVDAVGNSPSVPIWATPGIYTVSTEDVFQFKCSIPEKVFFESMSPYWSHGECGRVFKEGMRRLRGHFVWVAQPDGSYAPPRTITPEVFVEILASMRDNYPLDVDRAAPVEVERARQRYAELLQDPDEELGTAVLDAPFVERETDTSHKFGSNGSSPGTPTVEKVMNGDNKRKTTQTLHDAAREAKRLRLGVDE